MRTPPRTPLFLALAAGAALALFAIAPPAVAIGTNVGLGVAGSYSVLGGQSVTNTGPSTLSSNVGVNPGTSITGFPPGLTGGVVHVNDSHSLQAQSDLVTAYNSAAGQALDATVGGELGGRTLTPGVYKADSSTQITGPLTLDAGGNPDAVFIFQVGSDLTTATSSSVVMLNDAQSCHVFWQVGASATLGTNSTFVGTIMALTSITANTGATVEGRALARNGSVTLDSNVFTDVRCATTSTTSPAPSTSTSVTTTATPTATSTATPSGGSSATTTPTGTLTGPAPDTQTATVSPASTESGMVTGADSTGGGASSDQLAATGGPSGLMLVVGSGAALAGLVLILSTTRRRAS